MWSTLQFWKHNKQNLAFCPISGRKVKRNWKQNIEKFKKGVLKSYTGILNAKTLLSLVGSTSRFRFFEIKARNPSLLCSAPIARLNLCVHSTVERALFSPRITADISWSLKHPGNYNLSTVILYMSEPVADPAVLRLLPCTTAVNTSSPNCWLPTQVPLSLENLMFHRAEGSKLKNIGPIETCMIQFF